MSLHLWNRISSTRLSFLQPSWVKVKAGNLGSWVTISRDRARKREGKCWMNRPEAWTNLWVLHCDWKSPFGLKTSGWASRMGQFSSLQLLSHVRLFVKPHESQHASPPCPSPTPRVYPDSCPLSQWCHQTTLSSVVPFSSCLQSFPASESFQMHQFFASGGQSIGVSASPLVLPMNT